MLLSEFILIFIFLLIIIIFYQRYIEKNSFFSEENNNKSIQSYLLIDKEISYNPKKKPILWIYIPYEYNSRHWESFGSRSSCNLNQPYLYLTAKTIIKNCDESFMICFIDDRSFNKLLPEWNINMSLIGDPVLSYIRRLGIMKLIYKYGGLNIPLSFLCFKNLINLYEQGTKSNKILIGENIDQNITSVNYDFYPNIEFIGAQFNNETIGELINFMERIISNDYTAQTEFLGEFNRWCNKRVDCGKINVIDGKYLGVKNRDEEVVNIEILLGEEYIEYYKEMYGIWIPDKMILKRKAYEWFARMSEEQILKSNFILAKYILIASAPDSKLGVIEPLTQKPDWISFWKVPLNAPVWGLQPVGLGDFVPREKFPDQYLN